MKIEKFKVFQKSRKKVSVINFDYIAVFAIFLASNNQNTRALGKILLSLEPVLHFWRRSLTE